MNARTTGNPQGFESTQWTAVFAAGQSDSVASQAALEELCQAYWFPLYAYLRRKGHSAEEAEDLTQEFFATRVVTRRIFQGVDPAAGRFRSWLLRALQNMVLNEAAKLRTARRGGSLPHLPLDFPDGEERYELSSRDQRTPELEYDRAWAMTLIRRVLAHLQADHEASDRGRVFHALKAFLPGTEAGASYEDTARALGSNCDAVKTAVHRLRKEFGQRLRLEVRRTVSTSAELQEELAHLLAVLNAAD